MQQNFRRLARETRFRAPAWLAAFLIGSLIGLLLRLLFFVAGAQLIRLVGEASLSVTSLAPWLDPVYSHAALRGLADLHLQGIAVAGPPGTWLHTHVPQLFADAPRARWGLARVVVEPGSPVIGRLLAAAMAHAGVLGLGLLVLHAGWRRKRVSLSIAGVAMQLQVALGIIGAQPSVRELEATGLSFAANALAPWLGLGGTAVSDWPSRLWPPVVAASLVGLALLVAYSPSGFLLLVRHRARRITIGTAALIVLTSAACAGLLREEEAMAAVRLQVAPAAVVQVKALLIEPPPDTRPTTAASAAAALATLDRWFDEPPSKQPEVPSKVVVVGSNSHYEYRINGQPQVIKGMGLNTQYSQQLSPAERAQRLDADMAAMEGLGINTVLGWDPAEFDNVLLDAAQRHGIGVVMPFDLDPDADFTDPRVRQTLHDRVMSWVAEYRGYPALRMWGLGNEVLHKIVHPAWVGPQDPERERQAVAFSDWLVETADAIHALDPDHPVTYRSAEDAFVDWVVAALKRHPGGARPWFVWGTNCYQRYLADIVDRWPDSGMPMALWVSEFAPGGMAVPDRPDGFAAMWGVIRRNPNWVLGGAVYAWTRNGPEGVDRNFGLTDDGQPVDGRSLDMLNSLFHTE
jgi:hypothetical protein